MLIALLAQTAEAMACDEADEDLASFLAGSYSLIGREPDFGASYTGAATLRADGCHLAFVRCVNGERVAGSARLGSRTADEIQVLETRYRIGPQIVQGVFLIDGDLDNYALLNGKWVIGDRSGTPGREHWYVEDPQPVCE
jgi:hypothetical protein